MKKLFTILTFAALTLTTSHLGAQAFDKSTKQISIGLGPASMWHFGGFGYGYGYGYGYTGYSPITGQLCIQGEFAVHKYVGVGFNVGIGGRAASPAGRLGYGYGWGYPEFNIPLGAIANFHFYQLIADKTGKGSKMHSDKLDIYAGLNLGTGVAIYPKGNYFADTRAAALFWAGPQVGINYWFKPNIGVQGEVGYGKTFINAGIAFKL
ncbi:MAG: hypothetical protein JST90_04585 [Bacteroidetes bacterium]|nr:hypothetical protein [Bacteroidota bacterium]